jgi:hypothetical protein
MEQILNDEELEKYQDFIDGKIFISKNNDAWDDVDYALMYYKRKCYDVQNEVVITEKEIQRQFVKAILSDSCWIENFDVELIIEKYKGKCLLLNDDVLYFYINDDLIFTYGFEKVKLIDYIVAIHCHYNYYGKISNRHIINIYSKKLYPIKEEKDSDDELIKKNINIVKNDFLI